MKKEKIHISQHELEKDWFYQFFKNKTIRQSIALGILAGIVLYIWQNVLYFALSEFWSWLG